MLVSISTITIVATIQPVKQMCYTVMHR